jgi:hypothetical protein
MITIILTHKTFPFLILFYGNIMAYMIMVKAFHDNIKVLGGKLNILYTKKSCSINTFWYFVRNVCSSLENYVL